MQINYFAANKGFRLLNIYERLNKGEAVIKEKLAAEYAVSPKTIQRDLDDLRAYIAETHFSEGEIAIKYNKSSNSYSLVRPEREWMTNEEALSLCKILLESRAFQLDELNRLIEKLIMQISPADRPVAENIIRSELFNYVPLRHGKKLMSPIWVISEYITEQKIITFSYMRQDGKSSVKTVKPVSVMFSEFYFYLIAFSAEEKDGNPIVFRIDRISEMKPTGERFTVPYRERFSDGDFRKRIQFMYSGELKKVTFEYSGVLEAILDRLPTARIITENNGVYTIKAEAYGNGIYMWLRSQGELVKIIENG